MKKNTLFISAVFCGILSIAPYSFANESDNIFKKEVIDMRNVAEKEFEKISQIQKTKQEDEIVNIKGYVIKKMSKDKFLFKDSSGQIILSVNKKLADIIKNISNKTEIEITGKYRKGMFYGDEIEVRNLTILK